MGELVDPADLKSSGQYGRPGSSPGGATKLIKLKIMDDIQKDLEEMCDHIQSLLDKYGDQFSCLSFMEVDTQGLDDEVISKIMNGSVGTHDDFKYLYSKSFRVPIMLIAALDALTELLDEAFKDEPLMLKIAALRAFELIKMHITMANPDFKKGMEERKAKEQISADVDEFLKKFYKGEA